MSKFSQGDKVRCVDDSPNVSGDEVPVKKGKIYTIGQADSFGVKNLKEVYMSDWVHTISKGRGYGDTDKVGEIVNIDRDFEWHDGIEGRIEVKLCDGIKNSFPIDQVELISKGSEQTMDDVDAIAVEVDDENLREPIVSKAKSKFGFEELSVTSGDYLIFSDNKEVYSGNSFGTQVAKDLGALSDNWNKVVEFLEPDKTEPPMLNGREAEVWNDGMGVYKVKLGCWQQSVRHLREMKVDLEKVGVTSGTVTVKGEKIDVEEFYEFVDELEEYIEQD